jgi:hypothetical protein
MNTLRLATVSLIASLSVPAGATAEWAAVQSAEEGIPVLTNPATPRDGAATESATELWRWGADEDDPLIARIADAIVDEDGNTYVLDANMSQIHVLDPTGQLLRTMGGEGNGPGEFRNAMQFAFMPQGDIGIAEMMPGRIVVMDREGQSVNSFKLGGPGALMSMPQRFDADTSGLVVGHFGATFGDGKMVSSYSLSRFNADGTPVHTLREETEESSGGNISISNNDEKSDFTRRWAILDGGRVLSYAKPYDYELVMYSADGVKEQVVRREYETRKRTEEELEASRQRAADLQESNDMIGERLIEEFDRDIREVYPRSGGGFWVANSHGDVACPEGALGVFDVYDAAGHYVNTLQLDGIDYDPARDEYVIDGDLVVVFEESRMAAPRTTTSGGAGGMQMVMISAGSGEAGDADAEDPAPMEVVCYRIGG